MNVAKLEEQAFERVLGASPTAVEDAVIAGEVNGETSLERVTERLSELLDSTKGDVLTILGVSRTKVSGNPVMDVGTLDRAGKALKL